MYKTYKRFFIEGKQQAIQMLQKYFGNNSKIYVKKFESLDPTYPKNKYVDTFVRIFLNEYNEAIKEGVEYVFNFLSGCNKSCI